MCKRCLLSWRRLRLCWDVMIWCEDVCFEVWTRLLPNWVPVYLINKMLGRKLLSSRAFVCFIRKILVESVSVINCIRASFGILFLASLLYFVTVDFQKTVIPAVLHTSATCSNCTRCLLQFLLEPFFFKVPKL